MARLFLFLIIVGTFGFTTSVFGGTNATISGSGRDAYVLINSSLAGTLLLPAMGVVAVFFPRPIRMPDGMRPVSIWRRSAALILDLIVVMSILTPPIVLTMLFLEKLVTGEFVWSVHRTYTQPTDLFMWPIMIFLFVMIFYYFYKHAKLQRSTAGQFILGYTIVPVNDPYLSPKYMNRTFGAAFAGAIWPITLLAMSRRKDGIFWWDQDSNTRAVMVL